MNIIITTTGGGIFSLFHWALEELMDFHLNNPNVNINSFKILISNNNNYVKNKKIFYDLFEIKNEKEDIILNFNKPFNNRFLKVEKSSYFNVLKKLVKINSLNPQLMYKVNKYVEEFNINQNTLGVHLRITDMNVAHPEYGIITIDDYISKIQFFLEKYSNIDNIFISSDNTEGILTILKKFEKQIKICYIKDIPRVNNINDNNYDFQIHNLSNSETYHTDIFTELLVLSKCKYFIHRISDFANACILFSDTIEFIESLN